MYFNELDNQTDGARGSGDSVNLNNLIMNTLLNPKDCNASGQYQDFLDADGMFWHYIGKRYGVDEWEGVPMND